MQTCVERSARRARRPTLFVPSVLVLAATAFGNMLGAGELENWTAHPFPVAGDINGVASSGTHWVAVAGSARRDGSILVSTNGTDWRQIKELDWPQLNGVVFGDGTFVAVGYSGAILTSSDAESWVQQTIPDFLIIRSVAYGEGRFVAVGTDGTLVSDNGIDWVRTESATLTGSSDFVSFANGCFYRNGSLRVALERSRRGGPWEAAEDGLAWQEGVVIHRAGISSLAYGAGRYVAVGSATYVSDDGREWRQSSEDGANSVIYANSVFVATSGDRVRLSFDGIVWEERRLGEDDLWLRSVAYQRGSFVVVGWAGTIFQSEPLLWNYARWSDQVLGEFEAGLRAPDRDARGDDVPNLLAYAFDDSRDARFRVSSQAQTRLPRISVYPRDGASDVRFHLLLSEDLKTWTAHALEDLPHQTTISQDGRRRVTAWPASTPADALFVRLGVSLVP